MPKGAAGQMPATAKERAKWKPGDKPHKTPTLGAGSANATQHLDVSHRHKVPAPLEQSPYGRIGVSAGRRPMTGDKNNEKDLSNATISRSMSGKAIGHKKGLPSMDHRDKKPVAEVPLLGVDKQGDDSKIIAWTDPRNGVRSSAKEIKDSLSFNAKNPLVKPEEVTPPTDALLSSEARRRPVTTSADPLSNRKPKTGLKDTKKAIHRQIPPLEPEQMANHDGSDKDNTFVCSPGGTRKRLSDCKPLDEDMLVLLGGRSHLLSPSQNPRHGACDRRWSNYDGAWFHHPRLGEMLPLPGQISVPRWSAGAERPRSAEVAGGRREQEVAELKAAAEYERLLRRRAEHALLGVQEACRDVLREVSGMQELAGRMSAEEGRRVGEDLLWRHEEEAAAADECEDDDAETERRRASVEEGEETEGGRRGGGGGGGGGGAVARAEERALQAETFAAELLRRMECGDDAASQELGKARAELETMHVRVAQAERRAQSVDEGAARKSAEEVARLKAEVEAARERAEDAGAKWRAEKEAGELRKKLTTLQEERIVAKDEEIERLQREAQDLKKETDKHRATAVEMEMRLAVAEEGEMQDVRAKLEAQREKLDAMHAERLREKEGEVEEARREVEALRAELKEETAKAEAAAGALREEVRGLKSEVEEQKRMVEAARGKEEQVKKVAEEQRGELLRRDERGRADAEELVRLGVEKDELKRMVESESKAAAEARVKHEDAVGRLREVEREAGELEAVLRQLAVEARAGEEKRRSMDEDDNARAKSVGGDSEQDGVVHELDAARREIQDLHARVAELLHRGGDPGTVVTESQDSNPEMVPKEEGAVPSSSNAPALRDQQGPNLKERQAATTEMAQALQRELQLSLLPALYAMEAELQQVAAAAEEEEGCAAERERELRATATSTLELLRRIRRDDDLQDRELASMAEKNSEAARAQTPEGGRVSPAGREEQGRELDMTRVLGEMVREGWLMRGTLSKVAGREQAAQKELEAHRRGIAGQGLVGKLNAAQKEAEALREEVKSAAKTAQEEWEHKLKVAVINAEAASAGAVKHLQEELAVLYNNHGSALKKAGDLQRAEEMYKRAIQNRVAVGGEDTVDLAPILINLAAVHLSQGANSDAEPLFAKAYQLRLGTLGEGNQSTVAAKKWLIKCRSTGQRSESARPLLLPPAQSSSPLPPEQAGTATRPPRPETAPAVRTPKKSVEGGGGQHL